jgi:hypothetical protein
MSSNFWFDVPNRSARGLPPNKRLKLPAPVRNELGWHLHLWCCRLSFVNTLVRRRSLSAIR